MIEAGTSLSVPRGTFIGGFMDGDGGDGVDEYGGSGETVQAATYGDVLGNPWLDVDSETETRMHSAVGHTATLLFQRGHRDLARLLLDIPRLVMIRNNMWAQEPDDLWIEVAPETMLEFGRNGVERVQEAFSEVSDRLGLRLSLAGVREVLPKVGPGWEDQLRQQLSGGKRPTNHARRVRVEPTRPVEDGLTFTNEGELMVYRALKKLQESLPEDDTIGIFPLAGGRIPGHTWEPDVLVTYKRRAGVVEIDGPHHNTRRAMDITRDRIWFDAGVALVDRIPVEALSSPRELEAVLRKFLKRLADTR
jgi:hypothetical protein